MFDECWRFVLDGLCFNNSLEIKTWAALQYGKVMLSKAVNTQNKEDFCLRYRGFLTWRMTQEHGCAVEIRLCVLPISRETQVNAVWCSLNRNQWRHNWIVRWSLVHSFRWSWAFWRLLLQPLATLTETRTRVKLYIVLLENFMLWPGTKKVWWGPRRGDLFFMDDIRPMLWCHEDLHSIHTEKRGLYVQCNC